MKEYTAEEQAVVWLDSLEGLTDRQKRKMLALTGGLLSVLQNFRQREGEIRTAIGEKGASLLRERLEDKSYFRKVFSALQEKNILCITCFSQEYPPSLSRLPEPPAVLYCKGNVSLLEREKFAIVGARKILPWAAQFGREVARAVAEHFVIITGLAEGGDACALRGGAETGNVICVLPYGFDYVYPTVNAGILKKTEESGLVITEYPPFISPQRYYFLARNRIIAGLAKGVLVLSAAEKSGALSTAHFAMQYGKDVFAVPYNPGIESGKGANGLLKEGAFPVDCVQDVLAYYGLNGKAEARPELTEAEQKIYACLTEAGELHVSLLSQKTDIPVFELNGLLSVLEIKGYVARLGGNRFAPVR